MILLSIFVFRLSSILSTNRRYISQLDRISSMRAATKAGLIFGEKANIKLQRNKFAPKVIENKLQSKRITIDFKKALAKQDEWLCGQIINSANEEEKKYWEKALNKLRNNGYT